MSPIGIMYILSGVALRHSNPPCGVCTIIFVGGKLTWQDSWVLPEMFVTEEEGAGRVGWGPQGRGGGEAVPVGAALPLSDGSLADLGQRLRAAADHTHRHVSALFRGETFPQAAELGILE